MILRETQNQNDADDANDAESGIWYRVSPKQRHRRHYRHARTVPGVWGTPPEMRLWISKRYASKTCLPLKR